MIDYATGREMPADKLTLREVHNRKAEPPKRGALRIAKLMHAGDWNIARQAIPNLMDVLRRPPFSLNVVIDQKDLFARDPSLVYYPLIYIHGRASLSFPKEDLDALRSHLDPGGGTLFADAACGSAAFDASFRRFVTELLPNNPLVPIPQRRRALHDQGRRRSFEGAVHQSRRRRRRLPSARGGADQRPLGHHLFEVRYRLRSRAAHRHRVQGLHLRKRPQDRRQYRHLLDASLT